MQIHLNQEDIDPYPARPKKSKAINFSPLPRLEFYNRFFEGVSAKKIDNWHWQLRNRITSLKDLMKFVNLSKSELNAFRMSKNMLPIAVTPHYMRLVDPNYSEQPIRKTVIPTQNEFFYDKWSQKDPLNEDEYSPVSGLVHRYTDRVLFLVTNSCSTYCRYCTRSRMVGDHVRYQLTRNDWEQSLSYIEQHPQVRDVLVSGGDPLTMENEPIEWLLKRLRKIPSVEIIRIGTKTPTVLPQRITSSLCRMLKKYHPLFISVHFTHPDELTEETALACERLADAGIPLGSQTVLLFGVNDDIDTMKKLTQGLLKLRVKPYYIYQCDPILGSSHFRTPISKGLEIIHGLRGNTSGYAVPSYVIDAPGGGGKIQLLPEYVKGREGDEIILQNHQGKIYRYPDPVRCK